MFAVTAKPFSLPLVIPGQSGPLIANAQDGTVVETMSDQSIQNRFQDSMSMIRNTCRIFNEAIDKVGKENLAIWQAINKQLTNAEDPIAVLNDSSLDFDRITNNIKLIATTPIEILAHSAKTRLGIIEQVLNLWQKAEGILNEAAKNQLELYVKGAAAELDLQAKHIQNHHQERMGNLKEKAEELDQKIKIESLQMDKLTHRIELQLKENQASHQIEMDRELQGLNARKQRFEEICKTRELQMKESQIQTDKELKLNKIRNQRETELKKIDAEITELKIQKKHEAQMKDKEIIGGVVNSFFGNANKVLGF
jgi:hypothetical protein